jgi:hypothetical protein
MFDEEELLPAIRSYLFCTNATLKNYFLSIEKAVTIHIANKKG